MNKLIFNYVEDEIYIGIVTALDCEISFFRELEKHSKIVDNSMLSENYKKLYR